jgi:hypothetical protein
MIYIPPSRHLLIFSLTFSPLSAGQEPHARGLFRRLEALLESINMLKDSPDKVFRTRLFASAAARNLLEAVHLSQRLCDQVVRKKGAWDTLVAALNSGETLQELKDINGALENVRSYV